MKPKFIIVGNSVYRALPDSIPSGDLQRFYSIAEKMIFCGHPEPENLSKEESRALDYCYRRVRQLSR